MDSLTLEQCCGAGVKSIHIFTGAEAELLGRLRIIPLPLTRHPLLTEYKKTAVTWHWYLPIYHKIAKSFNLGTGTYRRYLDNYR